MCVFVPEPLLMKATLLASVAVEIFIWRSETGFG